MAEPELLNLDAVVFADYWDAVLDEVAAAAPDARRIVDLGAGTGTGALGLARRFGAAEVVAVDSSDEMLAAITAKNGRVTTLRADLDDGWPPLDDVDVTFASMALHHLSDPARVLRQVHAATRPGGIVVTAEFREPVRVLRDDYGVEARALAGLRAGHPLPELAADWATRLRTAGFEIVTERTFDLDVRPPLDDDARRYAERWLARLRHGVGEHLDPASASEIVAALDDVTDRDLHLHGRRHLTIGRRRPSG